MYAFLPTFSFNLNKNKFNKYRKNVFCVSEFNYKIINDIFEQLFV
jgi:hypothetical protein